jgi:PAS domain S-box-containing protein
MVCCYHDDSLDVDRPRPVSSGAALLATVALLVERAWEEARAAEGYALSDAIRAGFLTAGAEIVLERTQTYVALLGPGPADAGVAGELSGLRERSDRHLAGALAALRSSDLASLLSPSTLARVSSSSRRCRNSGSESTPAWPCRSRRARQSWRTSGYRLPRFSSTRPQNLRLDLLRALPVPDKELAEHSSLKHFAWITTEQAGRVQALVAGALAQGRAPLDYEFAMISKADAQGDLAWQQVRGIAGGGKRARVTAAVTRADNAYFGRLMTLREEIYRAARRREPIAVYLREWTDRGAAAFDALVAVQVASAQETAQHVAILQARAGRNYLTWALMGLLGVVAVMLSLLILNRRVLQPLRALTDTMARLAEGDLTTPVPEYPRRDELGAMVQALRTSKARALQAARLRAAKDQAKRRAAQAIQDSEARLRAIVDSVTEGILTVDAKGRIESANPAALKLFGRSSDTTVGQGVAELVPEAERQRFGHEVQHYIAAGTSPLLGTTQEVSGLRADGTLLPLEVTVTETELAAQRILTVSVRDIAARKAVDRMKSEFVSTVSHELRTPLTSIRGSLALLLGPFGAGLAGQTRSLIEIAHRNAERLIALVNDILDIERIEGGRLEFTFRLVDLAGLVKEAVEANQSFATARGVAIHIAAGAPPRLEVLGDAGRLLQVLANLLSNAAKFSEPGGVVTVEVGQEEQGVARVAVHDTGPGVPDEFRSRIFQKFAQADGRDARKEGGTGLGLSICKAIVERHGGRIGFDSRPGATRFFFTVPSLDKSVAEETESGRTRGRILVCEDDADTARLLRLMIEREGFAVEIAPTIAAAREMLARRDGYAAVTVDLSLPDGSGLDLVRELQGGGRHEDLPVIVISASAAEGRRVLNSNAVGVIGCLDKPFEDKTLEAALRRAVRGRDADAARVLYVEDDPGLLARAGRLLEGRASLVTASSAAEALERAKGQEPFDVVILGITLLHAGTVEPDVLLRLRELPGPPAVMILAASDIDETAVEAELKKVLSPSLRTADRELITRMLQLIGEGS